MRFDVGVLGAAGRLAWRFLLLVIMTLAAVKVADVLISRLFRPRPGTRVWQLEEGRARTLASLLRSAVRYTVSIFAFMMALDMVGIDTRSLLGGVAIAGLAIGFGAQNLVRDVISGFFIIYERQYDVGDYIKAAGVAGVVEEIGLRVTRLRDWSGEVHVIPNGKIDVTTNLSRAGSRALIEVSLAREADVRRGIAAVQQACERAAREMPAILEGPQILGVKDLGRAGVNIFIWARTRPLEQWAVERELRQRIKGALDAVGIEVACPRPVLCDRSGEGGGSGDQVSRG